MPLSDRAINILATIDVELTRPRPLVFVCHSYGGLLVKQLLRAAEDIEEYRHLAARVEGITFLGTPHTGAGIATYVSTLGAVLRSSRAVRELQRNEPLLRDLNRWFRNSLKHRPRAVRVYFETQPTRGLRIVDEASSDPGLAGVTPVAVDADHLSLCKPDHPDFRVKQTIALIQSAIKAAGREGPSLVGEILAAPEDAIPFVEAKIQRILAADPGNANALAGRALLRRMERRRLSGTGPLGEMRWKMNGMESRMPGRPLLWSAGLFPLAAVAAWKAETLVPVLAVWDDIVQALARWFS